jgi:hypothetical protein
MLKNSTGKNMNSGFIASRKYNLIIYIHGITVFDAIRWISRSWNNVREETILKCFQRAGFALPETDLQEQEDSASEYDLVSALPEALQFEVASKDYILENEAKKFCSCRSVIT